jgi:small-conductance mechanosensitive channel
MRNQVLFILLVLVSLGLADYLFHFYSSSYLISYQPISPYISYIETGINVVVVSLGGYLIIRIINKIISRTLSNTGDSITLRIVVDIILYTLLSIAILAVLGVNLTGVLVGGAVGGIVIGLAVQTIAQNVLSGIIVTASKTIKPMDKVSLVTNISSNPIIGEVRRISSLFTEIRSVNGTLIRIPNSMLFGNTIFHKLEGERGLVFPYTVNVNADVPYDELINKLTPIIQDYFSKINAEVPKIYFTSRVGSYNVFTALINFNSMENLNTLIDFVNRAFDQAYWRAKEKSFK